MRRLALVLAILLVPTVAPLAAESRVFVRTVPDAPTFETYSRVLNADRFTKFVIDLKSDEIYYFDVNLYRLHTDFVFAQIYRTPLTNATLIEFNRNYDEDKPRFVMGYLTHHLKTDLWTYSFWEGDGISAKDIRRVNDKLAKTFYVKKLAWRPDSPMQEKRLPELKGLATLTNDKIYKAASYQAFNAGRALGRLRVVPPTAKVEDLIFERDDIVLLQESYPDISPVAGIVSTVFSTPLSHVNLRAKEWRIPNAGLRDAGKRYKALDGQQVVLEVRELDHTLRAATPEEQKAWRERVKESRQVKVPPPNTTVTELRPLDKMKRADSSIYGTKAANLGEIASAKLVGVSVPAGFGVPFSMYFEHLKRNGLDAELEKLLADPRMATDAAWRKQAFEGFREKLVKAPLDPKSLEAVWARKSKDLGDSVFVRSSTNAEDLEGFNGAGLHDTVPNVKSKEQLADALRRVWASLWNSRAVEERMLFEMDQRRVACGLLVQTGVNGTAAGVLITRNLLDPEDDRSYTINAKRGLGLRVVGGTTVPEQVIYDTGNFGTKIISRSDDPTMLVFDDKGGVKEVPNENKGVILTEARARALSESVMKVVPLFSRAQPLDVEWVMVEDKVWIVQARPYVGR